MTFQRAPQVEAVTMTTVTLGCKDNWTAWNTDGAFWASVGYSSNRGKCLGREKIYLYISQINKQLDEFIIQIGYVNETSRNPALPSKYIPPMSHLLLKEILWQHCYGRLEKARIPGRHGIQGEGFKQEKYCFLGRRWPQEK